MGDVKKVQVRWIEGKEFETTTESGHRIVTDAREHVGGKNHGPSPMDLLLTCLGSCSGISVVDILLKKRQAVTGFEIRVEGIVSEFAPKVYTDLELVYQVRGRDISPKAVEDAIQLSKEKYCGISEMLGRSARVKTRFEIIAETGGGDRKHKEGKEGEEGDGSANMAGAIGSGPQMQSL